MYSIEFDKMANPILAEHELTAFQCRILNFLFMQHELKMVVAKIDHTWVEHLSEQEKKIAKTSSKAFENRK